LKRGKIDVVPVVRWQQRRKTWFTQKFAVYDSCIRQQAARRGNREISRSLKSDRWTLAFPLLCWIVALFSLLSVLSLAATFHHNLDVTPPMGNVIFFGLLGTAGFCMPALSILQSEKLGWQRALSQLDKQIRSRRASR
jgi:hypothetical protein